MSCWARLAIKADYNLDCLSLRWHRSRYRPLHPESQQLDFIKADAAIEGTEAVNHGTRHVRLDDRGWLWIARQGVLVYDGKEWHPFSAGLPDVHFSDARLTYEDREGISGWGCGVAG